MRLKSIFISRYKNLKDFNLDFRGEAFIDIFVGKNGCGKSNLLEAIIKVFQHIVDFDRDRPDIDFNYYVKYEIDEKEVEISWKDDELSIDGRARRTIGQTPIPDTLLIYYSGHNNAVTQILEQYESSFSKRIKSAGIDDIRKMIGVGPAYKEILLTVLLIQRATNKARSFTFEKLGIKQLGLQKAGSTERTEPVIKLILQRPDYARGTGSSSYDIHNNDETDRYWKAEGITRDFLDAIHSTIIASPGGMTVSSGYFSSEDRYTLYLDIAKVQDLFGDSPPLDIFRQFDNLKTLGMLSEITIPLQLADGSDASFKHFSDGQFQSIYIYAVTELFKDLHCITLLDEPDAFLHPKWQFEFLGQITGISQEAKKTNHILMTSHSASTIAKVDASTTNLFDFGFGGRCVGLASKQNLIKSLSSGLISFTETEAQLSIHHNLRNSERSVVFVEGITDETILEVAWDKLFPYEERPFDIQNSFDRIFLRNLFSRKDLQVNYPGRKMFALFDFDEAYDDWNGLSEIVKGQLDETDPLKGLAKNLKYQNHYAILLPVPDIEALKPQVLNSEGIPWGRGIDSHISIELLFFKDEWLDSWFKKRPVTGGGEIIEFSGDKVLFSATVVPNLSAESFEVFRPVFEFIKSKILNAQAAA